MSLAKVQRWLSTRRSRRPKTKKRDSGAAANPGDAEAGSELSVPGVPRSNSVGSRPANISISSSASSNTIPVLELQMSPGERRRSNATFLSSQSSIRSDATTTTSGTMSSMRQRAHTHSGGDSGISKMLLKLSPSLRRRKSGRKSPKASPRGSPTSMLDRRHRQDDNISSTSEIWKVGEVRGGIALLSDGEQLKLPDSVLDGELKKEGFLQKHGRRFGGWKRRWFVLDTGEVALFKTESAVGFTGIIPMDQVVSINYPSSVASFGFTFEVVTTKRTYVLAAKTEEEAIHWVHILRRASHTDRPRTAIRTRPSRFFVKRDVEITEPRNEDELRRGLFRSEGTAEESIAALKEHLAMLDDEEAAVSADEPLKDDDTASITTCPAVDMASEGLAIDALQAFLNRN
ncbi:uncharacterized protein CG43867-like isoform X1 [Sycon ciliatum]|uniref:uncharacterized protein CG43867-like isoform X1 n=2 Tax=Sycon ciliatum TaxID=27933 RepID=UPI0031F60648